MNVLAKLTSVRGSLFAGLALALALAAAGCGGGGSKAKPAAAGSTTASTARSPTRPRTVAAFLKAHQMTGRMEYLIGSRPQLQDVWKRWGILAKADPSSPDAVEHSALIYGISASGKVVTLYPANFKPSDIVQDVPKLAAQ